MSNWQVALTGAAKMDLDALDNSVQKPVAKALMKLSESPDRRGHALTGNLAGYRAMVVGKKKIRIVYRLEHDRVLVLVIAIGQRRNKEVYEAAGERASEDGPERAIRPASKLEG